MVYGAMDSGRCLRLTTRLLSLLLLLATTVSVAEGKIFANSRWREGRLDVAVVSTNVSDHGPISCLMICKDYQRTSYNSCRAFNYQASTKTCEILSTALCDSEDFSFDLSADPTWRYYDVYDNATEEDDLVLRNHATCKDEGKCSSKCARGINRTCTVTDQCLSAAKYSHCEFPNNSSSTGICQCDTHYWGYNASHCIHQIGYSGYVWNWLWKKIVHDMCEVTFTVKSSGDFHVRFHTKEDYDRGNTYYQIRIGHSRNSVTRLQRQGSVIADVSTPSILTNTFQNFTLTWCNGHIMFGKQGQPPIINWTDTSFYPVIKGMGFYGPGSDSYIFLPYNLVDPYYPTNVETGVLRTNGHHVHRVKIMPDRSPVSSIHLDFECMAHRDCILEFGLLQRINYYQILIGCNNNAQSRIYSRRHNSNVVAINTSQIVSPTEFRQFWITFADRDITVGYGGDPTPMMNWTETIDFSLTHVSFYTCCGLKGYFKMLNLPQAHEYPVGGYV